MRFLDKELHVAGQIFAFHMRKLCKENFSLFEEVQSFIPHPVYISYRRSLDYHYFGKQLFNKGPEIQKLFLNGRSYIKKISCPISLQHAENKSKKFHMMDDNGAICNYTQRLQLNNKMTYMFTNKVILNEHQTLSLCYMPEDLGKLGTILNDIAPKVFGSQKSFALFQSLTKQEKKIINLKGNGTSNSDIAELLFISPNTLRSHIKNIYLKLDINSTTELIRYFMVLDMI